MILNKAMVDWLTVTSFGDFLGQHVASLVEESDEYKGRWKREKRLQYEGVSRDGVFIGDAIQRGKRHWMVQASGEIADWLAPRIHGDGYNVTRLDLQVTIRKPYTFDSRQCYDRLTGWESGGRQRNVSIVQSGDGYDTIYVGSRSSDRFTRIYIKPTDSLVDCLRFEVEYKADHAKSIFNGLRGGYADINDILALEVESMPELTGGATAQFLSVLEGKPSKPPIKRVAAQSSTLEWLRKQVTPTIKRLANDHEHGHEMRYLVSLWHDYCFASEDE